MHHHDQRGITTAEYAVGTAAGAGLAGLLFKLLTGGFGERRLRPCSTLGARTGGAPITKSVIRVVFWGVMAMAVTAGGRTRLMSSSMSKRRAACAI